MKVNVQEAKAQLSRLLDAALAGEVVVIAKAGKPLVKVEALGDQPPVTRSRLGGLEHLAPPPEDFDTMFAGEIDTMFNGKF